MLVRSMPRTTYLVVTGHSLLIANPLHLTLNLKDAAVITVHKLLTLLRFLFYSTLTVSLSADASEKDDDLIIFRVQRGMIDHKSKPCASWAFS